MSELKTALILYVHNFSIYDYIAYIWLFLTFLVFLVLSIFTSGKSNKLSFLLLLISFLLLIIGPFIIKPFLDHTIRANKIENLIYKKLHFSNTLIVDFSIKNLSKKDFHTCLIKTSVYKASKSKLKTYIYKLKPILNQSIIDKEIIQAGTSIKKRVVFDNFIYNKDINISLKANCY